VSEDRELYRVKGHLLWGLKRKVLVLATVTILNFYDNISIVVNLGLAARLN